MLRSLLAETAAPEYQDAAIGRIFTNAEALARKLLDRALAGDEKAQQMVIDRVEGKAGRAADPKTGDAGLERDLDNLDITGIDGL